MTGPTTKRQAAAEQTRQRLLAAATEQFSRRPYAEVTVGDIARTAGVSQGLVAHHFENKCGAYLATLREVRRSLGTLPATRPDLPPGARLRLYWEGHFTYLAAHPDLALNLILSDPGTTEATTEFEAARREGLHDMCLILDLDPDNPAVTMALRAFGAGIDRLTAEWLRAGQSFTVPVLVEAGIQLLAGALRGLPLIEPGTRVDNALQQLLAKH
ncbi:TetR/AcrR family transcriptional regulator [Micromonospora sp. NBC_01796]|uniref:TetR/AcrR family transcriptional regulator n=1 Tax=Micromonospora sp. NBC_01796 TaxID=2975987 RepID=UPI002DD8C711|nr:TetR family transcriptional regulator [Micromonospora sp. NBC_01796]WSA86497.1 TetR/AcrR family transcriptional regulator [Micromonospora sp. NBC_01796]